MNPNMASLPIPKTNVSLTLGVQRVLWFSVLIFYTLPLFSSGFNKHTVRSYYSVEEWIPAYQLSSAFAGMICHPDLQLSLDASGKAKITPGMILKPPHGPDIGFKVKIYGSNTDTVTCVHRGQKIKVEVLEIATNNRCWSFILVEDKLAPTVLCRDTTLLCTGTLEYLDSIPGLYTASDNCTPSIYLKISHSESVQMMDCGNDTFSMVTRTWTAIDPWGRIGSCTQKISLLRPQKSDIVFPKDTIIYCPQSNTDPKLVGQPTIGGQPLDKFCGWSLRYDDVVFNKCGLTKKIIRTWSVLDCCSLTDTSVNQLIQIYDTAKPIIVCRSPDTISVFANCEVKYKIPAILSAFDSCHGTSLTTLVKVDGIMVTVPGANIFLEMGDHFLQYIVTDPCGNNATCTMPLVVIDKVAPGFWCVDSIQISLPADLVYIQASTFPSIEAVDNCSLLSLQVRRTQDFCADGIDHTQFGDSVAICCNDVNKSFKLVFLATDIYGNKDSCLVQAVVVDKTFPVLDCEQDTTIKCGDPIPAWRVPLSGLTDNCVDSVKITIDTLINNINLCGIGQIKRRIIAFDKSNNRDTCFQVISIAAGDTLLASEIVLANDTVPVVGCSASLLLPDSVGYELPVYNDPSNACNRIFVNYTDTLQPTAGTSRCRITKRTWRVGDSCFSFTPIKVLVQIIVQDTTAFAPLQGNISGRVVNLASVPIEDVHVSGKNMHAEWVYDQMTGRDGTFSSHQPEAALHLNLKKEDQHTLNGISTMDLIRIQQHITGTIYLDNPLLEFAADVDKNGTINVLDLIELRKFILGLSEVTLPWMFVPRSVSWLNIQPGQKLPNEYMVYNTGSAEEFTGFRLGDVNYDAQVNHIKGLESRSTVGADLELKDTDEGLSFIATKNASLHGFQLSLISSKGWERTSIHSDILTGLETQFNIVGNELRISWIDRNISNIANGTIILKLRGVHSKNIFSGSLNSEWYDEKMQAIPIQLVKSTVEKTNAAVSVFPNPMNDQLSLKLDGLSGFHHWRLINPNGRAVIQGIIPDGNSVNILKIDTHLMNSGLYILELLSEKGGISRYKVLKVN